MCRNRVSRHHQTGWNLNYNLILAQRWNKLNHLLTYGNWIEQQNCMEPFTVKSSYIKSCIIKTTYYIGNEDCNAVTSGQNKQFPRLG